MALIALCCAADCEYVLYFFVPMAEPPRLLLAACVCIDPELQALLLPPAICHDPGRNACLGLDADRLLPMSQLPPRSGEPTTYAPRLTSLQVYLATCPHNQPNRQQSSLYTDAFC